MTSATGLLSGIELEDDTADLDVVAGLEAGGLQRADDAHPVQAVLDVGERLVVLEVVAGEQALDGLAGDTEGARPDALDPPAPLGSRAERAVLGELVLGGELC